MQSCWTNRLQDAAHDRLDLIVLPEACDRFDGMTVEEAAAFYRYRGDAMLKFFQKQARQLKSYIAYSAIMPFDEKSFYNSTFIIAFSYKSCYFFQIIMSIIHSITMICTIHHF